jgi:hypothetical protein
MLDVMYRLSYVQDVYPSLPIGLQRYGDHRTKALVCLCLLER